MVIRDLNHRITGLCQLDFNSGVNGFVVCYCDTQPAVLCISCNAWKAFFRKLIKFDELNLK
jgi:hypothetical protein